jgi:enoyl-CoA hydratase/carnithine racemase
LEVAQELAEKVLKAPPLASRAGVHLARRQWVQPTAGADMFIQSLKLHLTEDFKESSQAFVDKRQPQYRAK